MGVIQKGDGVVIASSFRDALYECREIENIWVCGGERVYEDALKDDRCNAVYLTHISGTYKCDRFFPHCEDFLDKFRMDEIGQQRKDKKWGTTYNYCTWKRRDKNPLEDYSELARCALSL
jgi:dihydrofolate reductase